MVLTAHFNGMTCPGVIGKGKGKGKEFTFSQGYLAMGIAWEASLEEGSILSSPSGGVMSFPLTIHLSTNSVSIGVETLSSNLNEGSMSCTVFLAFSYEEDPHTTPQEDTDIAYSHRDGKIFAASS
jgi:hypothetical protein